MKIPALLFAVCICCVHYGAIGEDLFYEQPIPARPIQMVVPVTIEGKAHSFLLDTGANVYTINPHLRKELRTQLGTFPMRGLGRDGDIEVFATPRMLLGEWRLPEGRMGIFDSTPFKAALGIDLSGIFGNEALKGVEMSVDFDRGRLKFISSDTYIAKGMNWVPLRLSAARLVPTISAKLANQDVEFSIDTGTNDCIGIAHERFAKLVSDGVIELDGSGMAVSRETATGKHRAATGRFTRGTFLGVNLEKMPVTDTGTVELLGMMFLINFNFILDIPAGRFYYQKRDAEPPIRHHLMMGMALTFPGDRCEVLALAPGGGPAAEIGIQKGDRILKFGDLAARELNYSSIYEFCLKHAGKIVDVEFFREGKNESVKAKLAIREKQYVFPPQ